MPAGSSAPRVQWARDEALRRPQARGERERIVLSPADVVRGVSMRWSDERCLEGHVRPWVLLRGRERNASHSAWRKSRALVLGPDRALDVR